MSAGLGVEAKTGLLLKLAGELGVTAEFGVGLSGCVTTSSAFTLSIPRSNCFRTFVRGYWGIRTVQGEVTQADVAFTWECVHPNGMVFPVQTYCGISTFTGFLDARLTGGDHIAQVPKWCGGPDPFPHHGGKVQEPCCEPLCDLQPGQAPCCGCYGGQ